MRNIQCGNWRAWHYAPPAGRLGGAERLLQPQRAERAGRAEAYSAGYEWNNRLISFSMRHQQSGGNFGDLASGLGYAYMGRSDHAFFGLNTRFGQFSGRAMQRGSIKELTINT